MNKIFWVGCFPPEVHSVGDHAQTLAVQKFLGKHFSDYRVKRFYQTEVNRFFKESVEKNDLIFIHSGGNFGDLYSDWHTTRKRIIASYPNNLTVQLPVTVHYNDPANFEIDKIFFSDKTNLLILCRTFEGAELLKDNFGCRVEFFPDFAFNLKPNLLKRKRSGVLGVFRSDNESMFKPQLSNRVWRFLRGRSLRRLVKYVLELQRRKQVSKLFSHYYLSDVQVSGIDITDSNREAVVRNCMNFIAGFKQVITDRFHACVFAYLTDTPFVALRGRIPQKTTVDSSLKYEDYFEDFRRLIFAQRSRKIEAHASDVIDLIRSRRSIRKWNKQKVEAYKIGQLLEAAIYAPSAANTQATRFKVLTESNDVKFVCQHTSLWFRNSFPDKAILVFYDRSKLPTSEKWMERFIWQDTACSMMNMMLAAERLGLRTCWASVNPKQEEKLKRFFGVTKRLRLACMLFVGYSNAKVSLDSRHQGKPISRSLNKSILS